MSTVATRPVLTPTVQPALTRLEQPALGSGVKLEAPTTVAPSDCAVLSSLRTKAISVGMGAALGVAALKVGLAVAVAPALGSAVGAGAIVAGAVVAGYATADLASGLYHWMIDNYPTEKTPILGWQAKEFQEHHSDGDAMGKDSMWNVLAPTGKSLLLPAAALAILAPVGGVAAAATTAFAGTVIGAAWGAQAFHRWAHMPHPGPVATFLQKTHLAISRQNHLQHHSLQFPEENYCIINGMWNKPLGKMNFWRSAERVIYKITGREANSWKNVDVKAKALGLPVPEHFDRIKPYGPEYFKLHSGH